MPTRQGDPTDSGILGARGPIGLPGRGISNIVSNELPDGTSQLTFNFDDGTSEGPFTVYALPTPVILPNGSSCTAMILTNPSLSDATLTGNVLINGVASDTKLLINDPNGNTAFSVGTTSPSSLTVATKNNLLDDGQGNMKVIGSLVAHSNTLDDGSGNMILNMFGNFDMISSEAGSGAKIVLTSQYDSGSSASMFNINNPAFTDSSLSVIPGYQGTTQTANSVTYKIDVLGSASGIHYFDDNVVISGNGSLNGVTASQLAYLNTLTSNVQTQLNGLSSRLANCLLTTGGTMTGNLTINGLLPSSIVQTSNSRQLISSNSLPPSCSASGMVLTVPSINGANFSGNSTFNGPVGVVTSLTVYQTNTAAFNVTNASGVNCLNCDTANLSLTSKANTLDDGSGNMVIANNLTVTNNIVSTINSISNGTARIDESLLSGTIALGGGSSPINIFTMSNTPGLGYQITVNGMLMGASNNGANAYLNPQSLNYYINTSGVAVVIGTQPSVVFTNANLSTFMSWNVTNNILTLTVSQNGTQAINYSLAVKAITT